MLADEARTLLFTPDVSNQSLGDVTLVFAAVLLPIVIAVGWGTYSRGEGSQHREAYSYLTPAVISMSVLVFVPFLLGVGLAFTRYSGGVYEWVGLDNFISILSNEGLSITHPLSFYFTLGVTILWTAINVFFHASIGLCLALVLNRPNLRFSGLSGTLDHSMGSAELYHRARVAWHV